MSALLLATLASLAHPAQPTRRTVAALDPATVAGKGADVPFDEYEAENGVTDGRVIGPDRTPGHLAAEASGRRAVMLSRPAQFVQVRLARPVNALTVRYAIADAADSRSREVPLLVEGNGARVGAFALTSRYTWLYGRYPFTNRSADGRPKRMWDHARLLLGRTLPAGTRLRLVAGSGPGWIAVDLLDAELAPPPIVPPTGAVSVVAMGADPTGRADAHAAFVAAIARAQTGTRTVWVPPGRFRLDGHLVLDRVTLAGAGSWRSELVGRGVGLYGRTDDGGSHEVTIRDLAIIGEVDERVDALALSGVGGMLTGSLVERLWIQHEKVGVWLDGPAHDIRIARLRIVDTTADGINLHRGIRHAVVEHILVRGTGDDGLAAWSEQMPDEDISFRRNTVVAPALANGIAIYGGQNIHVSRNVIADTLVEGGGLHVGNRFDAVPVRKLIELAGNVVARSGSFDPNWRIGVGAVWFYAKESPIDADIRLVETTVIAPTGEAITTMGLPVATIALEGNRLEAPAAPFIKCYTRTTLVGLGTRSSPLHGPERGRCSTDQPR